MSAPIPAAPASLSLPVPDERPYYNPRLRNPRYRINSPVHQRTLDTCELLDQLHNFRMRANEFKNIDLYALRLRELIHQLKTAGDDPQPISRKQHKRVYLAGLRAVPHYQKALTTLYDIDNKDIKSIHNIMRTVCAAGIRASSAISAVTPTPKQFRYRRQRACCSFSPVPVQYPKRQ